MGEFTQQSGVSTTSIGALPAASVLRSYLAADVTYNNVDVLADTALGVTVVAAGKYAIELVVHSTNVATSLNMDFGGTATIANFIGEWREEAATANFTDPLVGHQLKVTSAGTDFAGGDTDAIDGLFTFRGSVEITDAGTFLLRGAQHTAVASDTKILEGSTLVLTKMN